FEDRLLKNSVDLVIPNQAYLADINAVAPRTPQLLYTNTSSLYQSLLTDWLTYANAHGLDREGAFYHVTAPTPFTGQSSSPVPVKWFWGVYEGGGASDLTDFTSVARSPTRSVDPGGLGTSLYIGYPDKFREINVSVATPARNGWSAVLEYATAVDAN